MDFSDFEEVAQKAWGEIPEHFKAGVDGLHVSRESPTHPDMPEVYTLGACVTEAWPSDWQGPETVRSLVVLYHGAFAASAASDPMFDWRAEVWETLTHELRHHLESLAGDDALEGVDYAMDEGFRREAGEDFDPLYYQAGDDLGGGLFRIEDQFFLERILPLSHGGEVEFEWRGEVVCASIPTDRADVHFLWVNGVRAEPGGLELVLVRRRGWWETLRRAFSGWTPTVGFGEVSARPSDSDSRP